MLAKYRNIILGVGSFIIFVFVVQMVFVKTLKVPAFTYANYQEKQRAFNTCYGDGLKGKQKELETFIKKVQTTENAKDIKQNSLELLQKTSCNVAFVSHNDEQIRTMAKKVVAYARSFFGDTNVKLLNTVYAQDEQFSAILQSPRSYLFYGLHEDEKTMVAFLATPKEDGSIHIQALWDTVKGRDEVFTQNEVSKLLLIYNQKIF